MSARREGTRWVKSVRTLQVLALSGILGACAQTEVGIELTERASQALDQVAIGAGPRGLQTQAQQAGVSPYLEPAPDVFEATGLAQWDGKRTLQGVWVAHPLATTARRVRIFNAETGKAVDGALFKRDAALGGASVLISSEAAQKLGIAAGGRAELRIVAVTPIARADSKPEAAAPKPVDQTDAPVEATVATAPAAAPAVAPVTPKPRPAAAKPAPAPQATVAAKDPEVSAQAAADPKPATAAPVAVKPAPAQVASAPSTQPDEPSDRKGEFKWAEQPVASAAAAAAKPEAPKKPKVQPAATPQTTSKLKQPFVQAGVFGVSENATKLIRRLKKLGIPASGKKIKSGGRQLTRVVAGPFQTIAKRNSAQAAIRKMGMRDAVPVRR